MHFNLPGLYYYVHGDWGQIVCAYSVFWLISLAEMVNLPHAVPYALELYNNNNIIYELHTTYAYVVLWLNFHTFCSPGELACSNMDNLDRIVNIYEQ